ncbi:histidine kinase [Actinoplanes sp. NPDC051633]|uniref:sensor histidine kinase n=1 Tax=Actinoplanes sp. NPDC051633 TaxID=3155670 RepID=UPI003444BE8E
MVGVPGLVWAFPAAFLCLMLSTRAAAADALGNGSAGAAVAAAAFLLPLWYTTPPGRIAWDRHKWLLLTVQVVVTYAPFVFFGERWALGLSGLLGGLLLLTLPARVSWLLFGAAVAVEAVLRLWVLSPYPVDGNQFLSIVFVAPIDMALPLFGLVRLGDLVTELRAARTTLAGQAVTRERLDAAVRLGTAVGDRLQVVTARAGSALTMLSRSADEARAALVDAATLARQATEQVRQVVAGKLADRGPEASRVGNTIAPRLALLVLIVNLLVLGAHHVVIVTDVAADPATRAAGTVAIVGIVIIQLYHSLAGRDGRRPRAWPLTLTVQVLLLGALIVAAMGNRDMSGTALGSFPAASALLLIRGRWAWPAFIAIATANGVQWVLMYPGDVAVGLYLAGGSTAIGFGVYGLSRLTDLAEELELVRRDLAREAVQRERVRVAQDSHDVLGLGLSAVALKCDLAVKLIGRDDARAAAEIRTLAQLAERTRIELDKITAGGSALSFVAELDTAAALLGSIGIEVKRSLPAPTPSLPDDLDQVMATVLREAVTNVLRHSPATRCWVELSIRDRAFVLCIANDGVDGRAAGTAARCGGNGLLNLADRVRALGGSLHAGRSGDLYELVVTVAAEADVQNAHGARASRMHG